MGKVLVKNLLKKKYVLSVVGRTAAFSRRAHPGIVYWPYDLRHTQNIPRLISRILKAKGKLDSIVFLQRFRGQGDAWQGEIDVSLTATKIIIDSAAGHFNKKGNKTIVIVSSIAGSLIVEDQPLSYHVGKAALNQMVRFYAVKLAVKGVRVNGVSPTLVLKPESKQFYLKDKGLYNLYKAVHPLNKINTAEEVADIIEFLMHDKSRAISGQNIVVDGALSLQGHESLAVKLNNFGE